MPTVCLDRENSPHNTEGLLRLSAGWVIRLRVERRRTKPAGCRLANSPLTITVLALISVTWACKALYTYLCQQSRTDLLFLSCIHSGTHTLADCLKCQLCKILVLNNALPLHQWNVRIQVKFKESKNRHNPLRDVLNGQCDFIFNIQTLFLGLLSKLKKQTTFHYLEIMRRD